jgi:hypothetical protein
MSGRYVLFGPLMLILGCRGLKCKFWRKSIVVIERRILQTVRNPFVYVNHNIKLFYAPDMCKRHDCGIICTSNVVTCLMESRWCFGGDRPIYSSSIVTLDETINKHPSRHPHQQPQCPTIHPQNSLSSHQSAVSASLFPHHSGTQLTSNP